MPMVKKIVSLILPEASLPQDNDARNDVILGFNKTIQRDIQNTKKCLLLMWIILGMGTMSIIYGFSKIDVIELLLIFIPIFLYIISLILFAVCKLKHNTDSTKLNYLVFVICATICGFSIFNMAFGLLSFDSGFDNRVCLLFLVAVLFMAYLSYWFNLLKFNYTMRRNSVHMSVENAGAAYGAIGYIIAKYLPLEIKLPIAVIGGLLISIGPVSKLQQFHKGLRRVI